MTKLKIYKTTSKALKLMGMSIPFVLMGLWMIYEFQVGSINYIVGWICTCFFGLGVLIGLIQIIDRRPQIIISENGVWDRTTQQEEIKWEQIIGAYPIDIFNQKFISIVPDDSFIFKKKPYKWASKLNKEIGAQNLNLYLGQNNIDESKLTELIHILTKAEKEDRSKIIQSFKIKKEGFSITDFFKIFLCIAISIALLLLSLTGITAFMTIMIIMGLSALTAILYWGRTEKSLIRKYARIIAWFGFINMILLLASLKTYDYFSENVGTKLTKKIEQFKKQNSSYPNDLNLITESGEFNMIDKIFINRVKYTVNEESYELLTNNLFNHERKYDKDLKEWKKITAGNVVKNKQAK